MRFDAPPEYIEKNIASLEEQRQKIERKLRDLKTAANNARRTAENKQIYNLGGIFRHVGWVWVDPDIAMGMIIDQISRLESYADKKEEILAQWKLSGQKENENGRKKRAAKLSEDHDYDENES